MKNLIIIEGKEKYQFDSIEELIDVFVGRNFYNLSEEDKRALLEKRTAANALINNLNIIELKKYPDDYMKNAFIVYDEYTYILSMLKFNKLVLLEKTDANIFSKHMKKDWVEDNYIIINNFSDEILENYLGEKFNG